MKFVCCSGACSGHVHNILHYKVNWFVQGHRSGNGHPSLTQEPLHTLKQACKLRIGKIFVLFNCNVTVHFCISFGAFNTHQPAVYLIVSKVLIESCMIRGH